MTDKYDEQIVELTENPEKIGIDWVNAKGLFQFVGIPFKDGYTAEGKTKISGCLTLIRRGHERYGAFTQQLAQEILIDQRIPKNIDEFVPEHFLVFAEWQRRIDLEFRINKNKTAV